MSTDALRVIESGFLYKYFTKVEKNILTNIAHWQQKINVENLKSELNIWNQFDKKWS